jgi:cobalt/nickel transport system permease protein
VAGSHRHLLIHGHSPLHGLAPEVKILGTFLFAIGVAITPRTSAVPFAVDAVVVGVLLALAGYRVSQVLGRATILLPFVAFAFFLPFVSSGERAEVAGLSVSREGMVAAGVILAKASIGFGASLVLAGTTPIPEIVRGLGRLRLPAALVAIISFMFRYLDLIIDELDRIRTAMVSRAHDPRWLWQARPLASAAGAMFVRSYERGERVHVAMLARGYDGTMPQLETQPAPRRAWLLALLPALVSWAGAVTALVWQ